MDAPVHDVLRIRVTGFQHWDLLPTRVMIEAVCEDAAGNLLHTIIRTKNIYADMTLSDALLKDFQHVLKLAATPKLENKPRHKVILEIADFLAFALLTKQIQPWMRCQRSWTTRAWGIAKKLGVEVRFVLGDPKMKMDFREFVETLEPKDVTATNEMLGKEFKSFMKRQEKLRGL